jgi:hypothetical protein
MMPLLLLKAKTAKTLPTETQKKQETAKKSSHSLSTFEYFEPKLQKTPQPLVAAFFMLSNIDSEPDSEFKSLHEIPYELTIYSRSEAIRLGLRTKN